MEIRNYVITEANEYKRYGYIYCPTRISEYVENKLRCETIFFR